MGYALPGGAMIYAILALIIVSTFGLLFLSYFSINYKLLDSVKRTEIGRFYTYQGLAMLSDPGLDYYNIYRYNYDSIYHMQLVKKRWGAFELYYATVLANNGDTICAKIALVGHAKNIPDSTALLLFNNTQPQNVAENVFITGKSYVPGAMIVPNRGYNSLEPVTRLYECADTITSLQHIDSFTNWVRSILAFNNKKNLYISDSIYQSFYKPVYTIEADTLFLSGTLSGNIIASARIIIVEPAAVTKDAVLLAKTIIFKKGFKGSLQAIATDTIIAGPDVSFRYPVMLAVLPDAGNNVSVAPGIFLGDSVRVAGSLYAWSINTATAQKLKIKTGTNFKITGGMYSAASVQWEGNCYGTIICRKISENHMGQDHLFRNMVVNIDSLPPYYSYDMLFPNCYKNRIAKWMETGKKLSRLYLPGSTLLEVIVASVIILAVFILFSTVLGKLYTTRAVTDEVHILMALPDITQQAATPYNIKAICPKCTILITEQTGEYNAARLLIRKQDHKQALLEMNAILSQRIDSLIQH